MYLSRAPRDLYIQAMGRTRIVGLQTFVGYGSPCLRWLPIVFLLNDTVSPFSTDTRVLSTEDNGDSYESSK